MEVDTKYNSSLLGRTFNTNEEGNDEGSLDVNNSKKDVSQIKFENEEENIEKTSFTKSTSKAANTGKKGGYELAKKAAAMTAVALAIVAFVAGTVGLLVYIQQLQLGLASVGTMSQATGLYTMLGGYGITLITGLLLLVAKCVQARKHKGEGEELEVSAPKRHCVTKESFKNMFCCNKRKSDSLVEIK